MRKTDFFEIYLATSGKIPLETFLDRIKTIRDEVFPNENHLSNGYYRSPNSQLFSLLVCQETNLPLSAQLICLEGLEILLGNTAEDKEHILQLRDGENYSGRYLLILLYLSRIASALLNNRVDHNSPAVNMLLLSYSDRIKGLCRLAIFRVLAALNQKRASSITLKQSHEIRALLYMNIIELGEQFGIKNFFRGIPFAFMTELAAQCGPAFTAWLSSLSLPDEWRFDLEFTIDNQSDLHVETEEKPLSNSEETDSASPSETEMAYNLAIEEKFGLLIYLLTQIEIRTKSKLWNLGTQTSTTQIDVEGKLYAVPKGIKEISELIFDCVNNYYYLKRDIDLDGVIQKIKAVVEVKVNTPTSPSRLFAHFRDNSTLDFYNKLKKDIDTFLEKSAASEASIPSGSSESPANGGAGYPSGSP